MIFAEKLQKLKDNYEKNKKWKLYLYLNGQCVSKKYISADFAPMNKLDTNNTLRVGV